MKGKPASFSSNPACRQSEEIHLSLEETSNPAGSRVNAAVSPLEPAKNFRTVENRDAEDFVTVAQAAELEGESAKVIKNRCSIHTHKKHYHGAEKIRSNGIDVWRIPLNSLSHTARAKHRKAQKAARIAELLGKTGVKELAPVAPAIPDKEYALQWELFERKPSGVKQAAQNALDALLAYCDLVDAGMPKEDAKKAIEASHGAARATLHRAISKTKKHPRRHWLPLLCPQWLGGRERAEYTPEAQAFVLALRVQSPQTNLRAIIRTAQREGQGKGWIIPSEDTVAKRLSEEAAWLTGGMQALERSFPVVERDYASLALHDCWESDGRRVDVFCVWPDGQVTRPFVIVWRDVRSRRVLSVRICLNPNAEAVLGSFGAALANAQAVPAKVKIDNGREYANKAFTGAQKTRYRFKPKVDEAIGILTAMGVVAKWSKPGQGRDKPIESWWNVIAEECDKYAAFAGAYCGNKPTNAPEDFDIKKAVPVEAYATRFIECVNVFHSSPHKGHGMRLRSPNDVYEELSATRTPNPPNESELRRCKMGVKSLKLDKKEATFKFQIDGYLPRRYWHEALSDLPLSMRDTQFNVHYEWDNPDAVVAVYSGDTFICDATPIDRINFLESDNDKIKAHMDAKGAYLKSRAKAIKAVKAGGEVAMPSISQMPELSPLPTPAGVLVPPRKAPTAIAAINQLEPIPGRPGESIDLETGEVYRGEEAKRAQADTNGLQGESDTQAYLAELKRKAEEARQEKVRGQKGEQISEAELEEMRRKQREKNLPAHMR